MIKQKNELHMEEILRAKYVGWNSHALSGHSSSLEHHHILSSGIFMEASSWRHGPSLTPLLVPLPFLKDGEWCWKFQSWFNLPGDPSPFRSPLRVTLLQQKILLSPRKCQGSFGVCVCVCVHVCASTKSLQSCPTLCDPMDCSPQAPLSVEFFRQEWE